MTTPAESGPIASPVMDRRSPARRRAGPGRVALVVSGVLLTGSVVACGDDDGTTLDPPSSTTAAGPTSTTAAPTTSAPRVIVVRVVDGQAEGGVRRQQVARGERVRIAVTADRADQAHLHGYDLDVGLAAGQTAVLELTADVPGVFELETHDTPRTILELEVR